MRFKRFFCMLMVCIAAFNCFCINVGAADQSVHATVLAVERASGKFSMDIPAGTMATTDSTLPLEVNETVTIKASYSPFSASVDFGLIDSDGIFHYLNVKNGSIDKAILISERGNYTFAIRNNSSSTISVSGYINY